MGGSSLPRRRTTARAAIGIEIDPQRIAEAKKNAAEAQVEDKVEFRQADLFKSNFKDATVITLYLLDELNRRLRPQIFAQVKPGTRIVSHAFSMGDWEPDAERTVKVKGSEVQRLLLGRAGEHERALEDQRRQQSESHAAERRRRADSSRSSPCVRLMAAT